MYKGSSSYLRGMNRSLLAIVIITTLIACKDVPGGKEKKVKTTETRIGKTNYFVTLPESYAVREKGGEDYTVYYFMPQDTLAKPVYAGGMYIGHYPTEFEPSGSNCRVDSLNSNLLDTARKWKLFICDSSWFVQTILQDSSSSIHAFGKGNDSLSLRKALAIFESIHK
jgi:hypothetical protein